MISMTRQLKIEFREGLRQKDVAQLLEARSKSLMEEFKEITRCHIVVERHHMHSDEEKHVHVNIRLSFRDQQSDLGVDTADGSALEAPEAQLQLDRHRCVPHINIYHAINASFSAIRQQLEARALCALEQIRAHHGRVLQVRQSRLRLEQNSPSLRVQGSAGISLSPTHKVNNVSAPELREYTQAG